MIFGTWNVRIFCRSGSPRAVAAELTQHRWSDRKRVVLNKQIIILFCMEYCVILYARHINSFAGVDIFFRTRSHANSSTF
jgi:hypothetical protein